MHLLRHSAVPAYALNQNQILPETPAIMLASESISSESWSRCLPHCRWTPQTSTQQVMSPHILAMNHINHLILMSSISFNFRLSKANGCICIYFKRLLKIQKTQHRCWSNSHLQLVKSLTFTSSFIPTYGSSLGDQSKGSVSLNTLLWTSCSSLITQEMSATQVPFKGLTNLRMPSSSSHPSEFP